MSYFWGGAVALRRLNRREYHNTVRDLLGVDFNVSELFPNDGTGGAGFDTNGETLFIPPLLMERYMEAAQQILDRAIVTPNLLKTFAASELIPAEQGAIRELDATCNEGGDNGKGKADTSAGRGTAGLCGAASPGGRHTGR